MEIITKFPIGAKVWTIRDCKAATFKVGCILYDGTNLYYGETRFDTIIESQCFATKEELLKHVVDDGSESM